MALARLRYLAERTRDWWLTEAPFFDVRRQRTWVFWRRVLHSAHHRTQLTVYLRLLNKPVPAVYGPTAEERPGPAPIPPRRSLLRTADKLRAAQRLNRI